MKERVKHFNPRTFNALTGALLAALFVSAGMVGVARAQDERAAAQTPEVRREREARRRAGDGAAGMLRALNLSPEQRAQIGAIRRETEPQGRALGLRLMQARRTLDEAIYSANPDERIVEERAREVAAAQAAITRLRTLTELKIRRVLSPEQLNLFRRLQRQTRTRRRLNQTPPPEQQEGDFPDADATPAARRLRNRMERRRRQEQQQQLPSPNDPNAQPPSSSAPRKQRRAPSRDVRPPRR